MTQSSLPELTPSRVLALLPPYPIVLVTTRDNVITVNQVAYFTFAPLRVGVGIAHERHTYGLLRAEGEFVINVPGAELLDAVRVCGTRSGRDGDKFAPAGLATEPSARVAAVSVQQCAAHIECRVEREIVFERRTWFVGPVVAARCREGHRSSDALMCGRHAYVLPGEHVAPR